MVPVYPGITSLAEIITRLRLKKHHSQQVSSPQIHICDISVAQYVAHLLPLLQFHLGTLTEPFSQADAYRDPQCTGADPAQLKLTPTTTTTNSSIFPLPS